MSRPTPGLAALVLVRATSAAGYYALLPYFGLWLAQQRGLSGPASGMVVAAAILATRAGGLVLTPVVRRLGLRTSVLTAYSLATAQLVALTVVHDASVLVWLTLATLLGLCLSAATMALKALVATAYPGTQRLRGFTYLNVAVNAGSAVGPAVAGLMLAAQPGRFPLLGAALVGVAALLALGLPATASAKVPRRRLIVPSRSLTAFVLLTTGTWLAYAQVFTVLPVYVAPKIDPAELGWVFTLNAVLVVALQLPVGALMRRASTGGLYLVANLLMAASLLLFLAGRSAGIAPVVAAMVLFTLAELVISPLYDSEVAARRGETSAEAAYATAGLAWGGAESAGAWIGIALVNGTGTGVPYWAGALLATGTGVALALTAVAQRVRRSPGPAPVPAEPEHSGR